MEKFIISISKGIGTAMFLYLIYLVFTVPTDAQLSFEKETQEKLAGIDAYTESLIPRLKHVLNEPGVNEYKDGGYDLVYARAYQLYMTEYFREGNNPFPKRWQPTGRELAIKAADRVFGLKPGDTVRFSDIKS